MSIDVQQVSPPVTFRDIPAVDEAFDPHQDSWAETVITIAAAAITVVVVSFVAALMAMN